jgi:hypothetical protein
MTTPNNMYDTGTLPKRGKSISRKSYESRKSSTCVDLYFVRQHLKDTLRLFNIKEELMAASESYLTSFELDRSFRGEIQAVAKFKNLRNYWKILILGGKPEPLPFLKSSKEGFPKLLVPFKLWINSEEPDIHRFIMTALSFYLTQTNHESPVDLSTVNKYPDNISTPLLNRFSEFLKTDDLFSRLKVKYSETTKLRLVNAQSIHSSAFFSASLELVSLKGNQTLLDALTRINDKYQR